MAIDLMGRSSRIKSAQSAGLTRPGMALVDLDGALLRVRDTGSPNSPSPTVVVAPDPPNVIEHYDGLISALEKTHRVVCFDLPGFGFSVPARGFRFSGDDYADISVALLRRLGVEAPVWAASCGSAYVGLRIATRYPGVLSGFVCAQAPSWEEELRWGCPDPTLVLEGARAAESEISDHSG